MAFKGTTGKWVLHQYPEGQMSVRNESNTRKICVPRVQNYEEAKANLLLISKAPEMLAALQKAEGYIRVVADNVKLANEIETLLKEATEI